MPVAPPSCASASDRYPYCEVATAAWLSDYLSGPHASEETARSLSVNREGTVEELFKMERLLT